MNKVEYSKYNKDIHLYGGEIYILDDKYYMVTVEKMATKEAFDLRRFRLCSLEDGKFWQDKEIEHMGMFYRNDFFERDMFGDFPDYHYVGNCVIKMHDAKEDR